MAVQDKTAVAVCTAQFEPLARRMVEQSSTPDAGVISLPFPLDTRPESEVRAIAQDFVPTLFELLGVEP